MNMIGQKFHRLTVIKSIAPKEGLTRLRTRWLCECECGQLTTVNDDNIKRGCVKSCGCSRNGSPTHGLSRTTEYNIWCGMIQRTTNPKAPAYPKYGGRGIGVCDRWRKFESFLEDMGNRPKDLTLERIDNDKGYYPENCKWDTRTSQARNRRSSRHITIDGVTKVLAAWQEISPVANNTFYNRKRRGLSNKEALGL